MNRKISLLCAFVFATSCAWCLPVTAQQLTRVSFPDGSGSIGLAPGWHIKSAGNGAVAAEGPGGCAITLGITVPCVARNVASQFPDIPSNALFPGMPRIDFTDAVRAFAEMIQFTSRHSSVSVTNVKLKAVERGEVENGHAAYIRYSATMNGKSVEVFGMYEILPVDQTSGMFYYSGVVAGKGSYASQLPIMMKMWKSWSLSKETINKRLQDAADALAKVDVKGTIDAVMSERRRVAEKAARDFQEYLRQ